MASDSLRLEARVTSGALGCTPPLLDPGAPFGGPLVNLHLTPSVSAVGGFAHEPNDRDLSRRTFTGHEF